MFSGEAGCASTTVARPAPAGRVGDAIPPPPPITHPNRVRPLSLSPLLSLSSPLFPHNSQSWRRPKGIDSRVRRKFKGSGVIMANIGYGSNKKTRHTLPSGFKKFVIHNPAELDILLMHNRTYAAEVAHGVGARKRALIVARAKELNVNLTNGAAKVRSQEDA